MKSVKASDVPKTVDQYFATVPEPGRTTLKKLRKAIRSLVPAETTEIITYRMPGFRYKGGLVCYAAFSDHCSLFPMDASLIVKFKSELKGYTTRKGTIQFPLDKPLPMTLLRKIVNARVATNEKRKTR